MTTKDTKRPSKFLDDYDLDGEREILKDLIDADDVNDTHPLWERYMTYLERVDELEKKALKSKARSNADPLVSDTQAVAMGSIGHLIADESDVLEVHTREAYRLFIGVSRSDTRKYGITSGKRVAAILRSIWNLSANDNPYADWFLISVTEQIETLIKNIRNASNAYEEQVAELDKRGLKLTILKSSNPVSVPMEFRSPYGYMISELERLQYLSLHCHGRSIYW